MDSMEHTEKSVESSCYLNREPPRNFMEVIFFNLATSQVHEYSKRIFRIKILLNLSGSNFIRFAWKSMEFCCFLFLFYFIFWRERFFLFFLLSNCYFMEHPCFCSCIPKFCGIPWNIPWESMKFESNLIWWLHFEILNAIPWNIIQRSKKRTAIWNAK